MTARVRSLLRPLSLVVALVLLAGACSSGGKDDDSSSSSEVPGPVQGGTLHIGMERPRSLDPADASPTAQNELLAADVLFDSLTRVDPKTGRAQPELASRFSTVGGVKRWRFRLDSSARFGNGRRINARDVKYSLERVAKKGTRSPAGAQLEIISGYRQFVDGKAKTITGIVVVRSDLVDILLTTPFSTLPEMLASPVFAIVPKEAVVRKRPAFGTVPIGSSAYRLQRRQGNVLHLVKRADVDGHLDAIDLTFFDDQDAAYEAFADRKLDWSPVPNDRVDEAAQRFGTAGFRPFHASLFYGFNLKHPNFRSQRMREAIVEAINRKAIVRAVYNDTVEPMDGVVIDGVAGRQDNPCGKFCAYNPTRARTLIRSVYKRKKPPQIAIDFDQGAVQQAIARAMADSLKKVGITARLRPRAFRQYQEFVATGQQQLFRLGWISVYPSADPFLAPLFLTNAPDNVTAFGDPLVDRTLKAARAEANPTKRTSLYNRAERLIMAKMPIVPIAQFETHSVTSSRVHDLAVDVDGTFDVTKVWVTGR